MIYLNAFIFVGLTCLLREIILDNTKLTPGHITSLFVSFGAILSFFNLYEPLINWAKVGASLPIISFGNLLYQACLTGYLDKGILGMFTNLLSTTSAGICGAVISAFLITIFFKAKD